MYRYQNKLNKEFVNQKQYNHKVHQTQQNNTIQQSSNVIKKPNKFFTIYTKPQITEISSTQREMREAIQFRFNNSKAKDYKYEIITKSINQQNDQSSHSSQMTEFAHLKESQNQRKRKNNSKKTDLNRIKNKDKSREQSISSGNTQSHSARKYRIKSRRQNSQHYLKKNAQQLLPNQFINKNQNSKDLKNIDYKQFPLYLKSLSPTSPYLQKIKFKSNLVDKRAQFLKNQILSSNDNLNSKFLKNLIPHEKKLIFKRNLFASTQNKISRFQKNNTQSHKLLKAND